MLNLYQCISDFSPWNIMMMWMQTLKKNLGNRNDIATDRKKDWEILCNFQLKKSYENVHIKNWENVIFLSLFSCAPWSKKIIKTRDNFKFFKYQISSSSKKVKSFLFYWDAILCVFMLWETWNSCKRYELSLAVCVCPWLEWFSRLA